MGDYIGYVGRVSPEKGVDTLLKAAEKHPEITFKAAGEYDQAGDLVTNAPDKFLFLGHLARDTIDYFIARSRIIVLCSIWYEGFPMILVEVMLQGRPIIASRLGGIPEVVDDGVTGLLFKAGNADDLAAKIQYLWERPNMCRQMGEAGRKKALREYSPETYYKRLMGVYQKAQEICKTL